MSSSNTAESIWRILRRTSSPLRNVPDLYINPVQSLCVEIWRYLTPFYKDRRGKEFCWLGVRGRDWSDKSNDIIQMDFPFGLFRINPVPTRMTAPHFSSTSWFVDNSVSFGLNLLNPVRCGSNVKHTRPVLPGFKVTRETQSFAPTTQFFSPPFLARPAFRALFTISPKHPSETEASLRSFLYLFDSTDHHYCPARSRELPRIALQ